MFDTSLFFGYLVYLFIFTFSFNFLLLFIFFLVYLFGFYHTHSRHRLLYLLVFGSHFISIFFKLLHFFAVVILVNTWFMNRLIIGSRTIQYSWVFNDISKWFLLKWHILVRQQEFLLLTSQQQHCLLFSLLSLINRQLITTRTRGIDIRLLISSFYFWSFLH